MEALKASYGESSSDSDSEPDPTMSSDPTQLPVLLPPPPLSLLHPPNSLGTFDHSVQRDQSNRIRSFPHVEGNFALHVYIPVIIPLTQRKEIALFLKRVARLVPELHAVDVDIPLSNLIKDEQKFEQVVLGREFHVSLGRTAPIRVHQRDSMVGMLRQRLQSHRRYWIDFSKWVVFVNDDYTRTFLSLEVTTGGLAEYSVSSGWFWESRHPGTYSRAHSDDAAYVIDRAKYLLHIGFTELFDSICYSSMLSSRENQSKKSSHMTQRILKYVSDMKVVYDTHPVTIKKQIEAVNDVYRLHNLPEFYKDPRPHISTAWAVGDISDSLRKVIGEETKTHNTIGGLSHKRLCACIFSGISCKIGNKTFEICKVQEE